MGLFGVGEVISNLARTFGTPEVQPVTSLWPTREEARASLQKNLEWLKRWTSTKILIEGHADSRGTNEYNLALAERRAASVRDYLTSLGLSADRMNVVSKGEEMPLCTEDNEACHERNRRVHFIITAK